MELFGDTLDLPFSHINPDWDMDRVHHEAMNAISILANKYTKEFSSKKLHVLIAGEQSYLIAFYKHASLHRIQCYVATSERNVLSNSTSQKTVQFNFIQFRKL